MKQLRTQKKLPLLGRFQRKDKDGNWFHAEQSQPRGYTRWDLLTKDFMQYIAGQLDGDGHVRIAKMTHGVSDDARNLDAGIAITMSQAANAWPALYFFRHLLGGSVEEARVEDGYQQAQRAWGIYGFQAWEHTTNCRLASPSRSHNTRWWPLSVGGRIRQEVEERGGPSHFHA